MRYDRFSPENREKQAARRDEILKGAIAEATEVFPEARFREAMLEFALGILAYEVERHEYERSRNLSVDVKELLARQKRVLDKQHADDLAIFCGECGHKTGRTLSYDDLERAMGKSTIEEFLMSECPRCADAADAEHQQFLNDHPVGRV